MHQRQSDDIPFPLRLTASAFSHTPQKPEPATDEQPDSGTIPGPFEPVQSLSPERGAGARAAPAAIGTGIVD